VSNAQEVRLSDVATWTSRRNDSNFVKRAGNRSESGRLSFGYFSLDKHDCMDAGVRAMQEQLPEEK